jgi:GTP-binding protein
VAERQRSGVLIAFETGKALSYSLEAAQQRGVTFVEPNEEVYEGMIVGLSSKDNDIDMNVTKGKHLTNTRASNKDVKTVLTPAYKMSLEQALDFLEDDELLEVTPKNLRLRKKHLTHLERVRVARSGRRLQPS